jgi:hypothetical protein
MATTCLDSESPETLCTMMVKSHNALGRIQARTYLSGCCCYTIGTQIYDEYLLGQDTQMLG